MPGLGLANARQVAVSPDSRNVYVASPDDGGVGVFQRGASGCALTFEQFVQDVFMLGAPVVDPADGSAAVPVAAQPTGVAQVTTRTSDGSTATSGPEAIPADKTINVPVPLNADQQGTLDRQGSLQAEVDVTFTAARGVPTTKSTVVDLVKSPATTGSKGPGTVSARTLRRDLLRVRVPRGRSARITRLLRSDGERLRFTSPERGRLTIEWILRTSRITKHHGHRRRRPITIVLARAHKVYPVARRSVVRLVLTKQGRGVLRSAKHRLRLQQRVAFTPAVGHPVAVTRRFSLVPRSRKR